MFSNSHDHHDTWSRQVLLSVVEKELPDLASIAQRPKTQQFIVRTRSIKHKGWNTQLIVQ